MSVVKQYKYLGIRLDESVDYNVTANVLAYAANRYLLGQLSINTSR